MKNVISLMVSADWHIGATDPYRFQKELINLIKDTMKDRKSLDLFVVAGDIFDMKEYLSSDSVKVFFLIMAELLEFTKEFNTQFRFIEGTRTHDALQLSTLKIVFENLLQNKRVKFIEDVTTEEVLGLDVLYIPEEYIEDKELYYKKYFEKHYDFIFGHGNTDLMWYTSRAKQFKGPSAPVFRAEELSSLAFYSYFGHFHYKIEGGNDGRFKSIGPVSRWEFGKEGPCGIYFIEYDKSTNLAIEDYILNKYAPILSTINIGIDKDYDLDSLNILINNKLNELKNKADKIRLSIIIESSLDKFIIMRDFILSSFGNINNVSLLIKPVNKEDFETKEEIVNNMEEKPYLYDKNMQDEVRIASFIRKKEGVNISVEDISKIIQKKDTKISDSED